MRRTSVLRAVARRAPGSPLAGAARRSRPARAPAGADLPAPARFSHEVQRILTHRPALAGVLRRRAAAWRRWAPRWTRCWWRSRAAPTRAPPCAANALILLADRHSPAALSALRHALLAEPDEEIRAAAVLGLQRLALTDPRAAALIRSRGGRPLAHRPPQRPAGARPAATWPRIRALLASEPDPEVRQVAMQLIVLAEIARARRWCPTAAARLRTTGRADDPQIVFRPARGRLGRGHRPGDLRVELPTRRDLPLAPLAEVVGGVVPGVLLPRPLAGGLRGRAGDPGGGPRDPRVPLAGARARARGSSLSPTQFVFLRELAARPDSEPGGAPAPLRGLPRLLRRRGGRSRSASCAPRPARRPRQLLAGALDGGRRDAAGLRPRAATGWRTSRCPRRCSARRRARRSGEGRGGRLKQGALSRRGPSWTDQPGPRCVHGFRRGRRRWPCRRRRPRAAAGSGR